MKRHWILLATIALLISCLCACGKTYTCYKCKEDTSEAYYNLDCDEDRVMCEDCARKYWMPLSYESYRVK